MANEADDLHDPDVLDICDDTVLQRGIPAEGEDPTPWLGAVLRTVVDAIRQLDGVTSDAPPWQDVCDGLAATAEFIQAEMLTSAASNELLVFDELSMPCPGPDHPQERRTWAQSMTALLVGMMATYQPLEDGRDGAQWWALVIRGLDTFSEYVQSDNGPLTWT